MDPKRSVRDPEGRQDANMNADAVDVDDDDDDDDVVHVGRRLLLLNYKD